MSKLYHYSVTKFKELLTIELQGVGKEKWKDAEAAAKFRSEPYPYHKHVSFLMDPAPLDILGSIFPKDHHTWGAGTKLWEYTVDIEDIDILYWVVVESPINTFMVDNLPWLNYDWYKRIYFSTRTTLSNIAGNRGDSLNGLKVVIDKYKGATRDAYINLANRSDFKDLNGMYAPTVPHLKIYTEKPIPVSSVKRVEVAPKGRRADIPIWLSW